MSDGTPGDGEETLGGTDSGRPEQIEKLLHSYRCQYMQLDDNQGGMPLVDVLSPQWAEDIALGRQELELLAEHIADGLTANATLRRAAP